ncbi:hypothetical protein BH11PSE14_BH11PSE14_07220 [soil metagenome]
MNRMTVALVAALGATLGGCASDPYASGMRYQDGGYYSQASAGRGDYYVAPDYRDSYSSFGDPFYDPFVFGPSWYGGGYGYCSVRYRYCPSGWIGAYGYGRPGFGTSLWLGFGRTGFYNPWSYSDSWAFYDPWAFHDPWIFYDQSRGEPRHHRRPDPREEEQTAQIPRTRPDPDAYAEAGTSGWAEDSDGDGRPDERALARRQMLRAQPTGQPDVLGEQQRSLPWFDAQAGMRADRGRQVDRSRQMRWGGEADGGRRSGNAGERNSGERSSGGRSSGERSSGERSSGERSSDGDARSAPASDSGESPRGRRRERNQ